MNEQNAVKAEPAVPGEAQMDAVTLGEGVALLKSHGGTLTAQVQITRKATGKVENYTLTMSAES